MAGGGKRFRGLAASDSRLAILIGNSIRHNIPGGHVDIRVAGDAGRAALRVANTGPAIPADQIGRLLEPFQRLSSGRRADDQGLGLGLSIVAAIAKAHHAALTIGPGSRGGLNVDIGFPSATVTVPVRQAALAKA